MNDFKKGFIQGVFISCLLVGLQALIYNYYYMYFAIIGLLIGTTIIIFLTTGDSNENNTK